MSLRLLLPAPRRCSDRPRLLPLVSHKDKVLLQLLVLLTVVGTGLLIRALGQLLDEWWPALLPAAFIRVAAADRVLLKVHVRGQNILRQVN